MDEFEDAFPAYAKYAHQAYDRKPPKHYIKASTCVTDDVEFEKVMEGWVEVWPV